MINMTSDHRVNSMFVGESSIHKGEAGRGLGGSRILQIGLAIQERVVRHRSGAAILATRVAWERVQQILYVSLSLIYLTSAWNNCKMPPKRKASSRIAANAASAIAYTDSSGAAPNKRSKLSKPAPKASKKKIKDESEDDDGEVAKVEQGRGDLKNEVDQFDHSRPEEEAGIVDRRFYPAEMSNERCAMYNANEIPRPMEVLNDTLDRTTDQRKKIAGGDAGQAVIHWFKRDLRVRDNTGLSKASQLAKSKGVGVIAVWLMSPQDWEAHLVSPAKCDFELRSVALLKKELDDLDIPLYIETVDVRKEVPKRLLALAKEWDVKNIFCNLEYEPDELRREGRLIRWAAEQDINFEPCHDDCVVPPGSVQTGGGRQYAVYSPWFRAWIAYLHANPHVLNERPMPEKNPSAFKKKFKSLYDHDIPSAPKSKALDPEQKERFSRLWPAGEAAAIDRITLFLTEKIGHYTATRNFPAKNSTASVSVHHAAGTLAARTSVRMARDVNSTKKLDGGIEGIRGWIGEVAWRDFYRHVLVNWPYVCMNKPFKFEYTNIEWEYSDENFRAWTEGRTGMLLIIFILHFVAGNLMLIALSRLPHCRRCNALLELHCLHAQPPAHDHSILSG